MKKIYKKLIVAAASLLSLSSIAQVTVTSTSGPSLTATYTSVNTAFASINAGNHTGTITIGVSGLVNEGTAFTPTALAASGQGAASYASVLIKPTATSTITGSAISGRGLLELDGADNVTIDGDIGAAPINKDLTIENTAANTIGNTAAIRLIGRTTLGLGATFNTIKNCIIRGTTEGNDGNNPSTVTSSYGILLGGASLPSAGDNNDNNSITNNDIRRSYIGIYNFGTATNTSDNGVILNNNIGSNTVGETVTFGGLNLSAVTTSTIQQNQIFNLKMGGTTSVNNYGIQIAGASSNSLLISRNNITGIWQESTFQYGAYGINITAGSNFTIVNNTISEIRTTNYSNTTTTWNAFGLRFTAGTNMNVYYNSINLSGAYTFTGSTSCASAPLCITSTAFTGNIRNNIFSNTMTSNATTATFVAVWMPSFTSYSTITMNNNAYMVGSGPSYHVGRVGTGTLIYTNLSTWQPVSQLGNVTNDNASIPISNTGGAPFISATNLNIPANTTTQIESGAVLIPALGTNTDFNAAVRPLAGVNPNLNPDMGAYEFDGITPPTCSGVPPAGSISGAQNSCNGASVVLNLTTAASSSLGISYVWSSSPLATGPFTNNIGTGLSQATGSQTTTLFYVATVSCAISGSTSSTSVYTVNFAPNPTVSVASSNSIVCLGSSANFTASGAVNYTWSPSASLTSSVGAIVAANPTVNTLYNVTGASSVGCIGTSSVQLSVNPATVTINAITASPAAVCANGSSTLMVTASNPTIGAYCQPAFTSGSGSGDYIGGVTLGTITNTTGPLASPYYTLYPQTGNTTTTLTAGQSYTITLQEGTYGSSEYLTAWIDYNQNGDLNNAGEKLGEVLSPGAFPTFTTIAFTVPTGAFNGNARLRVKCAYATQNLDACTGTSFGETEDYIVTIVGGVTPSTTISWTPSTFLSSTTNSMVVANTVTSSTVYTAQVTNAWGCSASNSVALTVNPNPTVSVANGTICSGNSFTLSPSGAASYSYSTGPVVTPTANSNYTVTGSNASGCTNSVVATVSVNTTPTVSAASSASLICNGSPAVLTATGASTYSWNTSATTSTISITPSVTTSYTVTGTTNGCSSAFVISQAVSGCVGINANVAATTGILVYPNPNTGEFTIELNNGSVKNVDVMDLTGRVIVSNTSSNDKVDFNISTLANGIYYVRIQSNNSVEVIKIVKQ